MSTTGTAIEKLAYIHKVTGFANLGIFPQRSVIERAAKHADALEAEHVGANLSEARHAIEIMMSSVLPSQAICQAGMLSVDGWIKKLRAQQRGDRDLGPSSAQPRAERPN